MFGTLGPRIHAGAGATLTYLDNYENFCSALTRSRHLRCQNDDVVVHCGSAAGNGKITALQIPRRLGYQLSQASLDYLGGWDLIYLIPEPYTAKNEHRAVQYMEVPAHPDATVKVTSMELNKLLGSSDLQDRFRNLMEYEFQSVGKTESSFN